MSDEQELWEVRDVRSGVARVYNEAKARSLLGIRVAGAWSIVVLLLGAHDYLSPDPVTSPYFSLGIAFAGVMLAALSVSRNPTPLLACAGLVVLDIAVMANRFPEMYQHWTPGENNTTIVRALIAPIVLYLILNGYNGSLAIQAFKKGFSPGDDWRTRWNTRALQLVVIGSCIGAVAFGFASWYGAVMSGFAQTNVVWAQKYFQKEPIKVKVGKPTIEVAPAASDAVKPGVFLDFNVLSSGSGAAAPRPTLPESARPIFSTEGMDEFATAEVEEAWEFVEDNETDEAGCVLEGLLRQDRCRDDRCRYWSRVFSRACLVKARKTELFCEGVPHPMDAQTGQTWALARCAGREFELCREIYLAAQGHCHLKTKDQLAALDKKLAEPAAAPAPPAAGGVAAAPGAAAPGAAAPDGAGAQGTGEAPAGSVEPGKN